MVWRLIPASHFNSDFNQHHSTMFYLLIERAATDNLTWIAPALFPCLSQLTFHHSLQCIQML
ncbi:unnamed protein product [Linum tenue]|uniref:Uncharacterized protein n=1 Tax=Linum tenue TaxID=586396 RepID=A0AAV0PWQ2_9ROSI|nr:unnamed protein product [Linum tenue]